METLNLRESSNQLTESEKITRTNYLNDIKTNIMKNGAAYLGTYMNNTILHQRYSKPLLNRFNAKTNNFCNIFT